jgi:hypothetical protein
VSKRLLKNSRAKEWPMTLLIHVPDTMARNLRQAAKQQHLSPEALWQTALDEKAFFEEVFGAKD